MAEKVIKKILEKHSGPVRGPAFDGPSHLDPLKSVKEIATKKDKKGLGVILGSTEFGDFAHDAYSSADGYDIRVNPLTGEKEMFVAGTKDLGQWGLNALDTIAQVGDGMINEVGHTVINNGISWIKKELGIPKDIMEKSLNVPHTHILEKLDRPRIRKVKELERIAKENGIQVLYGHSRGGALIADMKVPGATKVGLDAGMIMTHHNDMLNVNEGGSGSFGSSFDKMLGLSGQNNLSMDLSKHDPHFVYARPKKKRKDF